MAALVPAKRLRLSHQEGTKLGLTADQITQIKSYMLRYMQDLARNSQGIVRQRVVAVACIFMRRFYVHLNFCEYDPRMVAPACLYLASKTEESLIQAKVLFHFMKRISGQHPIPILDMKQLFDLEMALMEELDFQLVTETPYDIMLKLLRQLQLENLGQPAWAALNDSYKTDVCLMHTPQTIALACILLACNVQKRELPPGVARLAVDFDQVYGAAMQILQLSARLPDIDAATCSAWIALAAQEDGTNGSRALGAPAC
ncbi:hypothetical protein WJX74_010599 [Apatococcus lobatus]|uniref:Cyclin-like domain-containing protein n=1 Tax=Apatococcus lobatus TaxID=904363 RepID=A0AAW1QJV5_9CHLO